MNNKLNAYVRFDGTGKIVPSSVILQRTKPKVGNWKQIDSSECCNYTTTTTSTTSLPYPLSICVNMSTYDGSFTTSGNIIFTGLDGNGYPMYQGDIYDPQNNFTTSADLNYNTIYFPEAWYFFWNGFGGNGSVSEVTTELNPLLAIYNNPQVILTEGPCL